MAWQGIRTMNRLPKHAEEILKKQWIEWNPDSDEYEIIYDGIEGFGGSYTDRHIASILAEEYKLSVYRGSGDWVCGDYEKSELGLSIRFRDIGRDKDRTTAIIEAARKINAD